MWKYVLSICLITGAFCGPINAQGKAGLLKGLQANNNSDNKRKDVEGVVWEYKVMEQYEQNREEKTKMTGRLRIKQTALFAVGEVEYAKAAEEEEKDADKAAAVNQPVAGPAAALRESLQGQKPAVQSKGSEEIKEQAKGLLSQRLKQQSEEQTGSERIGDLEKQTPGEYRFRFDEDDDYPLSGLAVVEPDTTGRAGVWVGKYYEYVGGEREKRWRIEMRKIEE